MRSLTSAVRVISLDRVDSTMLEARRRLDAGEELPFTVVAAQQSGGVGRLGRPWSSPRGGWWFTVASALPGSRRTLRDDTTLRIAHHVHTACAAALAACGADPSCLCVKWPNDVMAGDMKLAGVLSEVVVSRGRPIALIGVGVNADVEHSSLDAAVKTRATTLRLLSRGPVPAEVSHAALQTLPQKLVEAIEWPGEAVTAAAIVRPLLWGVGRTVPITLPGGARVFGRIDGITDEGNLLATINGERHTIRSVEEIG